MIANNKIAKGIVNPNIKAKLVGLKFEGQVIVPWDDWTLELIMLEAPYTPGEKPEFKL